MRPRMLSLFAASFLLALPLLAQNLDISDLKRKAEAGDAKAQNELGVAYRMGDGVPKDEQEAARWYLRSAKSGSIDAMFNIGTAFYNGDGVPYDIERANAWFLIASTSGSAEARAALERTKSEGIKGKPGAPELLAGEIYSTDLAPNEEKAYDWFAQAAKLKNTQAETELCLRLMSGKGLRKDMHEAIQWCDAAHKHGDALAMVALGDIYSMGDGVPQDFKKSAEIYEKAAELRQPLGALRIARMYLTGVGAKKDQVEAYSWLLVAYSEGAEEGLNQMKVLEPTLTQDQISKAKKQAADWWHKNQKLGLHR